MILVRFGHSNYDLTDVYYSVYNYSIKLYLRLSYFAVVQFYQSGAPQKNDFLEIV